MLTHAALSMPMLVAKLLAMATIAPKISALVLLVCWPSMRVAMAVPLLVTLVCPNCIWHCVAEVSIRVSVKVYAADAAARAVLELWLVTAVMVWLLVSYWLLSVADNRLLRMCLW